MDAAVAPRGADRASALLAGTPYRVVRRLGEGGMGDVYEVKHDVLGKTFVVKLLREELAEDPTVIDRMRVEARSLATLSHPNIVAVTDFGRAAGGDPFLVMERLRGKTLGQELRERGALPPAEAVSIARAVLAALDAAQNASPPRGLNVL